MTADQDATITTKGQVTIPKGFRDRMGLRPGDRIRFSEPEPGVVVIRKKTEGNPFEKWRGYLKDLRGKDIDALIDEMRGR